MILGAIAIISVGANMGMQAEASQEVAVFVGPRDCDAAGQAAYNSRYAHLIGMGHSQSYAEWGANKARNSAYWDCMGKWLFEDM